MTILSHSITQQGEKMPDISKFKSVSVSASTHNQLESLAKTRFEVPVSIQKVIDFLLTKEMKKSAKRKAS
jgi:hypothetical protein